jgi:hypothetical protein
MASWKQQIDNDHLVQPSAIRGLENGSDALKAVLHAIVDHNGHQVGSAAPVAARSYNAMVAAASADHVELKPASSADTFRPLSIQQKIFKERYTTQNTGVKGRTCGGVLFFKVNDKVATAACPGTSNHGKGGAIDFDLDQKGALAWLEVHAKSFGWQWELSTEPWHLHYMLGDQVTQTVLDHEKPNIRIPSEEDDMTFITTPENPQRVVLLWGNKLVHVARPSGIDPDANMWDLSKDPDTWTNLQAAFGPVNG